MLALVAKSLIAWLLILGLAFANAGLRELVLAPNFGHAVALPLSGLLLCLLVLVVAWSALPWLGGRHWPELVAIGLGWLLLTVAFEWGLGWMQGRPVDQMLGAYQFKDGDLWPLVLAVTAAAPWLAARLRGWP